MASGLDADVTILFEKKRFAITKDSILEWGGKSLIRDQYAINTEWYGPINYKRFEVIGELDNTPGQLLIGNTGAQGYHVPEADCATTMQLSGRYVKRNYPRLMVYVHKTYRVPRKVEELICVETQLNVISPMKYREDPQSSWDFNLDYPHRMHQFEVIVWQSRKDKHNGNRMWRMGYVMNDMGVTVRIMIPNGRLYILKSERVVKFDFAGEILYHRTNRAYDWNVPDREFISHAEIGEFADYYWKYEEDLVFKESSNTSLITKFVKDTAFPRQKRRR